MKLISCNSYEELFSNKYVYLDNNFLEILLKDIEFLPEFIKLSIKGYLMIDPLIKFEFFRDLNDPRQIQIREQFLSQDDIFNPVIYNHETFFKIMDNAAILSRIISFKKQSNNISFIDLMLAGRVMSKPDKNLFITANRCDFPACVFDIVSVLNIRNNSNIAFKPFCVLKFNKDNFDKHYQQLIDQEKKILDK